MNQNKGVLTFLNEYILNPSPQYAVFINGEWGCGKTYFIQEWLENKRNEDLVPTPVYVSLYGLSTTKQISDAINTVLSPIIYGKVTKISKGIIKCASALVFKHSVDLDGDNQDDATFTFSVDPIKWFLSADEQVKSTKLLVFDDIERCRIDSKELLGYLNTFVEHNSCHVIIVGDEKNIEDKDAFLKFKEKTIGREFRLYPDVESAVSAFLNVTPTNEFLHAHEDEIRRIFVLTQCNNLRILKQCLWDFSRQEILVKHRSDSHYEKIMTNVLCSFIVTYCEYKGDSHDIIDEWRLFCPTSFFNVSEDAQKSKEAINKIQNKYNDYLEFTPLELFRWDIVSKVVEHINTGVFITDFIDELTKPEREAASWERLSEAWTMSNQEFHDLYESLIDDIISLRIQNNHNLGYAIGHIAYFAGCIGYFPSDEQKKDLLETLPKYLDRCTTCEELYNVFIAFERGAHSVITDCDMSLGPVLCESFNNHYKELMGSLKNSMTRILEELNDDNCEKIFDVHKQVLPNHSCTYEMVSIFNHVDISLLFANIKKMSNKGRQQFNSFIRNRYMLGYSLGNWTNECKDDIQPLQRLKKLIDTESVKKTAMDKFSFECISKSIAGALRRCNGELQQL
ncbi:MAG: hypothetical protein J5735_04155 [Prevotella sp.]|nr:hypothetical protein [Prevotella sp.]